MDSGWWREDMTLVFQAGPCYQSSAFSPSVPQLGCPCQAASSVAGSPWWPSLSEPPWQLQQMWVLPCGCHLSRSCRGPACPCPCSLPCLSAEHGPTGGTQQRGFTILPWFDERLKHLTRSLERLLTNILSLWQTCDLPYLVTGENKASWHGLSLSALDLVGI